MCLAIPGKVIEISEKGSFDRSGKVSFNGVVREVNLSCVPEAKMDDYVIVHVGLAISVVDKEEAEKIFEHVRESEEMLKKQEHSGGIRQ